MHSMILYWFKIYAFVYTEHHYLQNVKQIFYGYTNPTLAEALAAKGMANCRIIYT
jgi:hypothetical protein